MKKLFTLFILLFFLVTPWQAQTDSLLFKPEYIKGDKYVIKTVYGTKHTGYVINETAYAVTIENRSINEKIELLKKDIIIANSLESKKQIKQSELGDNRHADTYLFSGSAFEFEEGRVVTNNHWLLLQNVEYSISDNWAFTTNAFAFYPISLGIKCAYKINESNWIGGNAFCSGNILGSANSSLLWGYGALAKYTHGTTNNNFTLSGGLLGINANLVSYNSNKLFLNTYFVNAAYCNRFTEQLAVVTEVWYLPETQLLLGGLGIKFVNDERYCWTLGCYSFLDTYDNTFKINTKSFPIPYLGIGRKF